MQTYLRILNRSSVEFIVEDKGPEMMTRTYQDRPHATWEIEERALPQILLILRSCIIWSLDEYKPSAVEGEALIVATIPSVQLYLAGTAISVCYKAQ